MSCLNLKRLLVPKRVWQVFKKKLPLKLHRSKAIKKPRNLGSRVGWQKPHKKHGWASLSIQPKKFKVQHNPQSLIHHQTSHCYFRKGAVPVVVNQLAIQPIVPVVKGRVDPPVTAVERQEHTAVTAAVERGENTQISCYSTMGCGTVETSSCSETSEEDHSLVTADDMWESMVIASPQMHEINEKAEEFIARFRAEMHHQEMLARQLK